MLAFTLLAAAVFAGLVYLWRERLGPAGVALTALRTTAFGALLVAFFNPTSSVRTGGEAPTVFLDASLSMGAAGADWSAALDTARALAGTDGEVLRFGTAVRPGDTARPSDGASNLTEALRVAAGRAGPVFVVTDGEIDDWAGIPPSLLLGVGVVTLPRDPQPDLALVDIGVRPQSLVDDSIHADLTIGWWNFVSPPVVTVEVFAEERRLLSASVDVPESGSAFRRRVSIAPGVLSAGTHVLRFRVSTSGDAEPRDDERIRVVSVSSRPGVVVLVDPADVEGRFLVRELQSIVRGGLRGFARIQSDRWVEMESLAAVSVTEVRAAARQAALVVVRSGQRDRYGARAVWFWPAATAGRAEFFEGDWYVTPQVGPSPVAGALAAIQWDSVPPLTGIVPVVAGANQWVAMTGRLGRRGADRPLLLGEDSSGTRTLVTTSGGLWRWALRGGAALEAYRAVISSGVDWLLADRSVGSAPGLSVDRTAEQGRPLVFRWTGADLPDSLAIRLARSDSTIDATLRFSADGTARQLVDPGVYRWASVDGSSGRGTAVVETYSAEFPPRNRSVAAGTAQSGWGLLIRFAREKWWLFMLAMAALIGEWAWRQRRGLP